MTETTNEVLNQANMNHESQLQAAQDILQESPILFWFICLRNMPAGQNKDRVEALICAPSGKPRQVSESQMYQELYEELPRNPDFVATICRQYELLKRTVIGPAEN